MSTKPSLYEYYMKLIPDTVIFDEIERIAWQNNITCGTFDGSGRVDDSKSSLFFYSDGITNMDIGATRCFCKIYTNGCSTSDIRDNISDIDCNILFLDNNLNHIDPNSKVVYEICYVIIDDSTYHIKFRSNSSLNIIVVGVKF